jgi:hypothetical protein
MVKRRKSRWKGSFRQKPRHQATTKIKKEKLKIAYLLKFCGRGARTCQPQAGSNRGLPAPKVVDSLKNCVHNGVSGFTQIRLSKKCCGRSNNPL